MRTDSGIRAVRRALRVGFAVAAVLVGVAGFDRPASAQSLARVTLDFTFVAAGKELPPGVYEFEASQGRVTVRPQNVKVTQVIMPVITRLGRHDADAEAELVFDKVDGKMALSELWLSNADGFLLLNTPVDHEHRVVGGSKPHK